MSALRARLGLALTLVGLALTSACQEEPAPALPEQPAFLLEPVADPRLAELEASVEPLAEPSADAEVSEMVQGLVVFLMSAPSGMVDAAFEDVKNIGLPALPVLTEVFRDADRIQDQRRAALRLAAELDSPESTAFLVDEMASNPDGAMRALAAWKLEKASDDSCVLELLRRLKYEADPQVVPWLVRALASHANYAGVAPLRTLASWHGAQSEANAHLLQLAGEAGFESSPAGVDELIAAWEAGDPEGRLARPADARRSDRFWLGAWRRIADLDDFQLRGVDDTRYILADLGPWATPELARALHDSDRYVRTHVAQAIGRMGARGLGATDTLLAALAEPALAPHAAEALGSIGAEEALEQLLACSGGAKAVELRLAATRALGALGDARATDALRGLALADELPELTQAAWESLARLGGGIDVAEALIGLARRPELDAGTSMTALREWLGGRDEFAATVEAWDALAPDAYLPPTREQNLERRAARLELVEEALAGLERPVE